MKKKPQEGEFSVWVKIALGLALAIGLMLLAKAASAGNVNGASALQKTSTNTGTNGLGIQLVTGADFNGNTGSGVTVNCTNCGGSGAGTVSVSIANTTPVPVAPSQASITAVTHVGFTWSQTPVAVNVTSSAGVSGRSYIVRVEGMPGPCAAGSLEVDYSSSASTNLNNGWGAYIPASTTGGVAYGPYGGAPFIKARSLSSTNCNGSIAIEVQ